jgi:leucyl/phenylalanyl-tRNA--protein transferase
MTVKDIEEKATREEETMHHPSLPPELLLEAYASGIFPMGMPDGEIHWYSPDPRGIIPLRNFHTPHGLRRALNRPGWEIRIDSDFAAVMKACAAREETWITGVIAESYQKLFLSGHAHSVEVWHEGALAGGLYGVALGGAFFGESMFHHVTDASKVALWHLINILKEGGFTLLDTQWNTPHLEQFGTIEIARNDYLGMLRLALMQQCSFKKV